MSADHETLVEVARGDAIESCHAGSVVAVNAAGATLLGVGDPSAPTYLRSVI